MSTLLEALEHVTEEDLEEIDKEIETIEQRLAGLKEARRVVMKKLGKEEGKRPKDSNKSKPSKLAAEIMRVLQQSDGQMVIETLANQMDKSEQAIKTAVARNPNFITIMNGSVYLRE